MITKASATWFPQSDGSWKLLKGIKRDNMKWTDKKPTEEGWYWMRRLTSTGRVMKDWGDSIEYVRDYGGNMCISNWEVSDHALWAGPIEKPK
jgi:hypothetical protein